MKERLYVDGSKDQGLRHSNVLTELHHILLLVKGRSNLYSCECMNPKLGVRYKHAPNWQLPFQDLFAGHMCHVPVFAVCD